MTPSTSSCFGVAEADFEEECSQPHSIRTAGRHWRAGTFSSTGEAGHRGRGQRNPCHGNGPHGCGSASRARSSERRATVACLMSWELIITMRQGEDHRLSFKTEEEAKTALEEVNQALGLHPRMQQKGRMIAGRLTLKPADIRSAEAREWSAGVA
jgi:hypothetical protein